MMRFYVFYFFSCTANARYKNPLPPNPDFQFAPTLMSGLHSDLKVQSRERQPILILRVDVPNRRIGLLQLRLT